MRYCNKCNIRYVATCKCSSSANITINSDQAGRDGLSAYEISVLTGRYTGSESDFPEWLKGEKGDQGDVGDTYVPDLTDNFFDE